MFKKTKLYIGIALAAQAVSCFAAFLSFRKEKRGTANAFLAASLIGAVAGIVVFYLHARDRLKYRKSLLDINEDGEYDELLDLDEISSYDDIDDIAAEDGITDMPF